MITVETLELFDADRPSWLGPGPRPVRAHVRRANAATGPRPLVLISHGAGGASPDMVWLAEALATAGFLAVTMDHHGSNYLEEPTLEGFARAWDRPTDLRFLIDHFTEKEDVTSVGVAGFSLGGYAAAALVGARIEQNRFAALMHGHIPAPETPDFPNLTADLHARLSPDELASWIAESSADFTDSRVEAVLLMAPAIGQLIDENSLAAVARPVAVYWGDADEIAPPAVNAHLYANHIPSAHGGSVGGAAEHRAFTETTETPDGEHVRAYMSHEAVTFFTQHLSGSPDATTADSI